MNNRIIAGLAAVLFAFSPVVVAADTARTTELAGLVQQLNILLDKINTLDASRARVSIMPAYGKAPFTTVFTLSATSSTEALDFGDGQSTGSAGCTKNTLGYCALPAVIGHTYQYPGLYAVTLYDHKGPTGDGVRVIGNTLVYVF